jgi:hypothetical protein
MKPQTASVCEGRERTVAVASLHRSGDRPGLSTLQGPRRRTEPDEIGDRRSGRLAGGNRVISSIGASLH